MRRAIVTLTLLPALAAAAPARGERIPDLRVRDVAGESRTLRALLESPTLIVAITDRDGADAMRAWFERAGERAPGTSEISIVSLDLPFFVSEDYARSKAREQVPREHWGRSLLDGDGRLADELGLPEGKAPFVMVVDARGEVLARFHGAVTEPGADAVWDALRR